MAERNPGEALSPSQVTSAQGIQNGGFVVLNALIAVGNEQHFMNVPSVSLVPMDSAYYSSQDVPFQPLSIDYTP